MGSQLMLAVNKLSLRIGKKSIIENINVQVSTGDLCVVIGQNGSGKSSLLRCLSGWKQPSQGEVILEGNNLHSLSSIERASQMAFLPQRPKLNESIPIIDVVAAARYRFSESPSQSRSKAAEILKNNDLHSLRHRDWRTLSGGEAQRIALACLQAQDAKLWLLDEPANHLDPAVQIEMYQNLIQEWQTGRTLIVVTHNINLIFSSILPTDYSKVRVVGLQQGTVQFEMTLSDPEFATKIGSLYQVQVVETEAFGRRHLVFGVTK
jgi:iron complex transport system ATP-binding protein